MFFHVVLEKKLQLHPRSFGPHMRDTLIGQLVAEVEGTCSGKHGYVVAVTKVESIGQGMLVEGTPLVTFNIRYRSVVFRPFKGEILDALVTVVNKVGFFAEAGPVRIFVSVHLIPDDMSFTQGDLNCYATDDGSLRIQQDSEVRLKIVGTRLDATEIFCIGSIKDDYTGPITEAGAAI